MSKGEVSEGERFVQDARFQIDLEGYPGVPVEVVFIRLRSDLR